MAGIRNAQKQLTRSKIINSALRLMSDVGSACTVSMREVAKEAGIAPTSFYRHFKDLNEVSLALIEQSDHLLAGILAAVQSHNRQDDTEELRFLVESVIQGFGEHSELFSFYLGARYHSALEVRNAVDNSMQQFVRGLSEEVERRSVLNRRPISHSQLVAEAYASILFGVGFKMCHMHKDESPFLVEVMIQQLKMVYIGAEALAERAEKKDLAI